MADKSNSDARYIKVLHGEEDFFENLIKKYGIIWSFEDRQNEILPISKAYVGYINTPLRSIPLKPKYTEIGFEHILRMYIYVYGYKPNDSPSILDVSESNASMDIAKMFIKNLKRNVQEGIIRTYVKERKTISVIKGRVDYTKTYVNHLMQKKKRVKTVISSLSLKNDINDLILSALSILKHIDGFKSVANELSMYFEGASSNVTNGNEILNGINFNSNTSRYRKTLTYAAMIIDHMSYSDTGAAIGNDSFLINFDRLFEEFVIKILKEIPEKKEFSTWSRKQQFADVSNADYGDSLREYQPDILYRYKNEDEKHDYNPSAYAVLDVKNKAYGIYKNPDIYQMLTYVRLLYAQKALLLYPSFQERPTASLILDQDIFYPNPNIIYACFINIAETDGELFLRSINRFSDKVLSAIHN